MFGMSNDQLMGLLRQGLQIGGTLAVAFGFLTPDKVASLTATILQIAGPIMMLSGIIWNLIANKQTSIAASIGANPTTSVVPAANGAATVTLTDPAMARAALNAQNGA